MKQESLSVFGVLLMLRAGIFKLGLAERWAQRVPPGWRWTASFGGISTYTDTGQFPEADNTGKYQKFLIDIS